MRLNHQACVEEACVEEASDMEVGVVLLEDHAGKLCPLVNQVENTVPLSGNVLLSCQLYETSCCIFMAEFVLQTDH